MAFQLDSNIPLMAQVPDMGQAIDRGMRVATMADQLQQRREEAPLRKRMLEQQAQLQDQAVKQQTIKSQNAERDQSLANTAMWMSELPKMFKSGDYKGVMEAVNRSREDELGADQNADVSDHDEIISAIMSGDAADVMRAQNGVDSVLEMAKSRGVFNQGTKFSAATTWLPGGISVQTSTDGRKIVKDAADNVLTGQPAIDAINKAVTKENQQKVDVARGKEAAKLDEQISKGGKAESVKASAKQAIKVSGEAFERLGGIKENITNIDKAISAIDQGADTGFIADMFPSMKSSSIKLDTIQKQLGLDVISGATFGALSEGERAFAVSSALPSTLNEDELRAWLLDKRSAQNKMIKQLTEAATYLGTPGNNIAGFIEKVNAESGQQAQPLPDISEEAASLLDF